MVKHPFKSYVKGDHITDDVTVADILANRERAAYVVKKPNHEPAPAAPADAQ